MGVGQHAHIKHKVCITRHAALESKGLKHQGQLGCGRGDQRLDIALQLRGSNNAGVNHVRLLAQVPQQFALEFNRIYESPPIILGRMPRLGLRQRVFAPGLGVAAHQGFGGCVQKQGFDNRALFAQFLELLGHDRQRRGAADIHGNCHAVGVLLLLQHHKLQQQLGRQVVHAVVARVFQRMQGHRLARA